jgi:hypothetical protein
MHMQSTNVGKRWKKAIFGRNSALFALTLAAWLAWPSFGYAGVTDKPAPELTGSNWLNSKPLSLGDLKGRVVLLEFWTYG